MTNILLIDDDDDFRDAITRILTGSGHSVVALKNSIDLKETLNTQSFDVAVVDYFLPTENGIQIVKRFPDYKYGKNIPVIMISSHEGIRKTILESGIKYFMAKPLEPAKLVLEIARVAKN